MLRTSAACLLAFRACFVLDQAFVGSRKKRPRTVLFIPATSAENTRVRSYSVGSRNLRPGAIQRPFPPGNRPFVDRHESMSSKLRIGFSKAGGKRKQCFSFHDWCSLATSTSLHRARLALMRSPTFPIACSMRFVSAVESLRNCAASVPRRRPALASSH